ncbi:MAG: heavy-metal-associated domain-containing protein [Flavobacterium sp.]
MKIAKFFIALAMTFTLFLSCKNTENKPAESSETNETKKQTTVLKPETASFKIEGMTCSIGCAKTIEEKLSKMDGVQKATVDFDKKEATVEFDASVLTPEKLAKEVESTGDGETYKVSDVVTHEKA